MDNTPYNWTMSQIKEITENSDDISVNLSEESAKLERER